MTQIQLRRGTASAWTSANPTLALGEVGVETDTLRMKAGDGLTAWTGLSYLLSTDLAGKAASSHTHAQSDVTGLTTALSNKQDTSAKGQANGYASLDGSGLVPSAQLPSYVDDVLEYANLAAFPATGTTKIYRWSGSAYVEISPSPGSTDSVTEGSSNLYYTDARADGRISAAVGVTVQGYDADLAAFANKTAPSGAVVGTSDSQTLTNKTLTDPTLNNSTVTNYTESVVAIGTVTSSHTISLTSGTVQTATLTASTACTFTMPTATAGKSFVLLLKQAASTGNGTATFTGVKWGTSGAPTITATAGKMDILSFFSDGTNWYGSATQGFTP